MYRVEDEGGTSSSGSTSDQDEESSSTLVDALERKYLCDEAVDPSILLGSISPCKLASECALALLVLDHKRIDSIGNIERFNALTKNVVEVDLSFNRISSWNEIGVLLKMPKLNTLNIGYNSLEDSINVELPKAPHLCSCYMNGIDLSLSTIRVLLTCMPILRELYLSQNRCIKNGVDEKDTENLVSASVQTLHLIKCDISDWSVVIVLRRLFPSCHHLVLCENPIKKVTFGEATADAEVFKGLRYLSLNRCLIEDWDSIDSLADIETLRSMKLQHIPLLSDYSDEERFQLVVGRLPFLEELNGSVITEEHRIAAERFFIRYYDLKEAKPKIFQALVKRHGHVAQLCHLDLAPKKHVTVVVTCDEKGYKGTIRIPLAHSVLAFKRVLEKRLGIPVHQMRLFYQGPPDLAEEYIAQELRFSSTKLSSLRIEDGDQFCVQTKVSITRRATSIKKQ